jgi:hypothetical protein
MVPPIGFYFEKQLNLEMKLEVYAAAFLATPLLVKGIFIYYLF